MACGEIKVVVNPPTAGRRKPSQAVLESQISEIRRLIEPRGLGENLSEESRSYLQSLADAQVRKFGWLDGAVRIEFCNEEPEPVEISIGFQFQQRKMVNGAWTEWVGLNLNNPALGLSIGQLVQRRTGSLGEASPSNWEESPVYIVTKDEGGSLVLEEADGTCNR